MSTEKKQRTNRHAPQRRPDEKTERGKIVRQRENSLQIRSKTNKGCTYKLSSCFVQVKEIPMTDVYEFQRHR